MMSEFKNGEKIKALHFPDAPPIDSSVEKEREIRVIMENGQMTGVPWFGVFVKGELGLKFNGALVSYVELYEKPEKKTRNPKLKHYSVEDFKTQVGEW